MMSQHAYPVSGYGLYLDPDEFEAFANAYAKAYSDGQYDRYDVIAALPAGSWLLTNAMDDLDWWSVRPLDEHATFGGEWAEGAFVAGPVAGSCIATDSANLYRSLDEMAGTMFGVMGDCLPKGFDCKAHLAELEGTTLA